VIEQLGRDDFGDENAVGPAHVAAIYLSVQILRILSWLFHLAFVDFRYMLAKLDWLAPVWV
jgi:hypothetical protein